jgi:hypothetical protein
MTIINKRILEPSADFIVYKMYNRSFRLQYRSSAKNRYNYLSRVLYKSYVFATDFKLPVTLYLFNIYTGTFQGLLLYAYDDLCRFPLSKTIIAPMLEANTGVSFCHIKGRLLYRRWSPYIVTTNSSLFVIRFGKSYRIEVYSTFSHACFMFTTDEDLILLRTSLKESGPRLIRYRRFPKTLPIKLGRSIPWRKSPIRDVIWNEPSGLVILLIKATTKRKISCVLLRLVCLPLNPVSTRHASNNVFEELTITTRLPPIKSDYIRGTTVATSQRFILTGTHDLVHVIVVRGKGKSINWKGADIYLVEES